MKKEQKATVETKQNEMLIASFKEVLGNLRRFLSVSDRIYKTLNTSKKEMMLKEITNLQKIVSEF